MADEAGIGQRQAMIYAQDLSITYRKLRATVDFMSDGMIAADRNLKVFEANPMAARLLECEKSDLMGADTEAFFPGDGFRRAMVFLNTGMERQVFETDRSEKGGNALKVSVCRLPESRGYVFVLHDITAEKRAENLKKEFLSILSHEMRTPLNGIIGLTDILEQQLTNQLTPDQAELFDLLRQSGNRMRKIVEELLNYARFRGSKIEVLSTDVDLDDLLQTIIDDTENRMRDKRIRISFRPDVSSGVDIPAGHANPPNPDIPFEKDAPNAGSAPAPKRRARGDFNLLYDLFGHVLRNAMIFGNEGGRVTVTVTEGYDAWRITIADNGIGIPARDLDRIFDSFYQVQEHMRRNVDGLGLGLTIARHIAEFHGGSITMQSRLGQGATCVIQLPKAPPASDSPRQDATEPGTGEPGTGLTA